MKGEKKAGGLIITPLSVTSTPAPGPSSVPIIAPPRPSSSHGSFHHHARPPDKPSLTKVNASNTSASVSKKGKSKAREIVAPTRQDIEVEEEVRQMDAERERLRVREVQAQSQATLASAFKTPLLPPSSVPRRRQTGFIPGTAPSTPVNGVTIDTTQPIPLRDTPTIDRNRAMRGEPVERRRSSLSKRGKRASSSFEHTGIIRKNTLS